ncbi:hypothetical protein [Streptomyces acidiscabies]|uniref:Uncharacterized protein n=1 Tax=Streptomyces acidiscabies TaxID=42234 RepID=A0A0L0KL87_9ACTN|nr:hypothetical protein [Streptomyces acidiscabies]KND39007.1 hypothetical protein IQ63_05580 [Streptomyces acidiscabies]
MTKKFWLIVGCLASAALTFAVVVFLRSPQSGPDVESFRNSKNHAKFCSEAAPLDFSNAEELSAHERTHVIEALSELAPDGIAGEFERVLDWYEHPGGSGRERSNQATVRVGGFIERSCDEINIGGIRT